MNKSHSWILLIRPSKRLLFKTIALAAVIVLVTPSQGQVYTKLGAAGMKFLEVDANVRSAAMGGASTSLFDGVASMFQNPAGLAGVSGMDFSAATNVWIADIRQHAIGVAVDLNKIGLGRLGGIIGASLLVMDNGNMIRTDFSQVTEEQSYYAYDDPYTIEEWAAGIAYARRISDQFALGGHVKYAVQDFGEVDIYRDLEDDTVSVANRLSPILFDFGTIYYTGFGDLRISMSFRNFSQELIYVNEKFELPITMKIGVAMKVLSLNNDTNSLTVALDAEHPRDYQERINLGFEYRLWNLILRTGYRFNHDEESLSAGFGLHLGSVLRINYAYTAFGIFGAVQRISIAISS
ncbi:MAG: PorV/PorQ family protein [Fidelibacterota bacterium]|nr:MAG: PorV/PorQ family protein [Candidatus Neomarinimicrobiota bacterium]